MSEIRLIHTIAEADREEWNRLGGGPYFSYEWFEFVEAVNPAAFTPYYFLSYQGNGLRGILPAFRPRTRGNTYEDYLLGRLQSLPPFLLRPLRRQPLVCFSPRASGAFVFSDHSPAAEVLAELVEALEEQAAAEGMTETVFLCLKETEADLLGCLRARGYLQVYLNSVGMIQNRFESFEDYLQGLPRRRRKAVKTDLAAFARSGLTIEEVREEMPDTDQMYGLMHLIEQKYPSVERDLSARTLRHCFEKMTPYRTHFRVRAPQGEIGTLTHFRKDRFLNIYGLGLDFARGKESRAYFNLLYYHAIGRMIELRAPYLNFNQMAYKVKESRGCELVRQYMLIKPLRKKISTRLWTGLLDARYRRKFRQEYDRNRSRFEKMRDRPPERAPGAGR